MKIFILYPFLDTPWGGANQFLKAVRKYFIDKNLYEENIEYADIVLFNSSPTALVDTHSEIYQLKKRYQDKIFINRIDGPVFFIRDRNVFMDKAFYQFNDSVCCGTIFQSNWSRDKNYQLGMRKNCYESTILNAPDSNIFNQNNKNKFNQNNKIKLIATSWSSNMKKGFEVYKWLDENLDFTRYEFTFVGNTPVSFQNIKIKEPMQSEELANELKQHDIFITASQSDPCSNSLIEAMHCGLPAVGLDDGGHTEIIAKGGRVFTKREEIPLLLEDIVENYSTYQKNIKLPDISEVGDLYHTFFKEVYDNKKNKMYSVKEFSLFTLIKIKFYIFLWSINEKIFLFRRRFLS